MTAIQSISQSLFFFFLRSFWPVDPTKCEKNQMSKFFVTSQNLATFDNIAKLLSPYCIIALQYFRKEFRSHFLAYGLDSGLNIMSISTQVSLDKVQSCNHNFVLFWWDYFPEFFALVKEIEGTMYFILLIYKAHFMTDHMILANELVLIGCLDPLGTLREWRINKT